MFHDPESLPTTLLYDVRYLFRNFKYNLFGFTHQYNICNILFFQLARGLRIYIAFVIVLIADLN